MSALYQTSQIRELESCIYSKGIKTDVGLMNKAGGTAFRVLLDYWPSARSILVVAGRGNNGGDGFVLARLAKEAGLAVYLLTLACLSEYQGPAKKAAKACIEAGVCLTEYTGSLEPAVDVVVDAVLGIGLNKEVSGTYATVIQQINAIKKPVLSLDVPSGLDVDTGSIRGVAVDADVTVTFIALKAGLLTYRGVAQCGTLICDDLGLCTQVFSKVAPIATLIDWQELSNQLPKRQRDSHKGCYGHVLIIGGDYGMAGAVQLAAEAALRVGAGLVTVATRPEHVSIVNSYRPEIMCFPLLQEEDLEPLLERATLIVIGPGLGKTKWAWQLLQVVLRGRHPVVLDADALNLLANTPRQLPYSVLTPHPGEAARLLNTSVAAVQADRFKAAAALQRRYGGVIVLKGAGSIVQSDDALPSVCSFGNPGMASGGMGDVLSGVIGGLIAQQWSLSLSAKLGVMVHALAADRAAKEGGERGLLASDLMPHLRHLMNPTIVESNE